AEATTARPRDGAVRLRNAETKGRRSACAPARAGPRASRRSGGRRAAGPPPAGLRPADGLPLGGGGLPLPLEARLEGLHQVHHLATRVVARRGLGDVLPLHLALDQGFDPLADLVLVTLRPEALGSD